MRRRIWQRRKVFRFKTLLSVLDHADADGPQTTRLLQVRAAGIVVPPDYADRAAALADKDLDAAAGWGSRWECLLRWPNATKPVMRDVYTGYR